MENKGMYIITNRFGYVAIVSDELDKDNELMFNIFEDKINVVATCWLNKSEIKDLINHLQQFID